MPAHRIVVGPEALSRREEGRLWLSKVRGTGPALVVSVSLEASDHFLRELASERGSLFGVRRATLDSLAYRLALPALARAGMTTGSRLGQEAVTARLLHRTRRENRLGPLESIVNGPGLVRALTSTLHECRLHEVSPDELSRLGELGETLALLLAGYDEISREHGVADRALTLTLAREGAGEIESPTLLLDVPLESPLETALVEAIAASVPVCATAVEGDDSSIELLSRALGVSPEPAPSREEKSAALVDLQRHVFGRETPPRREPTEDVVILSAPGEAQEACELARAIQLEAEKGLPFDSVAVLLRSPELYTPLLEDAFRRASIPAHFEEGTQRPDPAGRAFLSLLDCAAEELSASRFAEYLSLSQLPKLDALGEPVVAPEADVLWVPPRHPLAPETREREPVQLDLFAAPEKVEEPEKEPVIEGTLRAPWRWEKLLVDAAVIGGLDRWERRLSGLGRELETRLLEIEDEESPEAETLRRERSDLLHLRNFALPLIEMLGELPDEESWGVWLDALERLASRSLAYPEGVLALLKELSPMASVGPVSLFEVRAVLSERLTLLPQRPSEDRYGKVWVAPIDAGRGMSFEMVLVPGLAERMFPRKIVEDPLLLDSDRRQLSKVLPLQKDRIARERLALRLAIGAATKKVVLSYPAVDLAKGRAKVPSFYLLEVARASQGELPDFETLARDAASSSGARLGWPAPRDRRLAIDPTEFDLAFLSDSLRRETTESEALGAGRYLVNVNDSLARSLRARYQRGRRGRFTAADGFVESSTSAREILARHRLEARAYSVTALEKYAACPYRFYLNAVLRVKPRETVEAVTHLDPLTKGSIVHDAQFHISKRLEEAGLLPVRPENLDSVLKLFEVVFDEVSERFHEELAPAIERIWKDELERLRFDLRGWLRRESQRDDGYVPFRRELTFGMRPRGPADPASTLEVAVLANGLRLRGAIDLVEKRGDSKVRITDHKSGRVWMPESAIVNGGENLQPILYTLAYEALTGEEVESARLYYVSQRAGYAERVVRADEEALDVVAEFQRRLDAIIGEGFFPASPKPPLGCKYCDYLPVCGPRMQIDAKRKQDDPRLSPLNWLRNLT
ncbi:MAG: PD-(D/E)XK nuclease family protein [Vicinamibacteria bacterium]